MDPMLRSLGEAQPPDDGLTVIMPTFDRVGYLELYLEAGYWDRVPLLVVDDGSDSLVGEKLDGFARKHQFTVLHHAHNEGPAAAISTGIKMASTSHVMMVGDDDYCREMNVFEEEAHRIYNQNDDVLMVVMPAMYVFKGEHVRLQYDRGALDGMSGQTLLSQMVHEGEMRALGAGVVFRRSDLLEILPEPFFRMANDFAMLSRLCSRFPDRKVYVAKSGTYWRLSHDSSISSARKITPEKMVMHLVSVSVGAYYLLEEASLDLAQFLLILQKRGNILQQVYGCGSVTVEVVQALLEGRIPALIHEEAASADNFLRSVYGDLPKEFLALLPEESHAYLSNCNSKRMGSLGRHLFREIQEGALPIDQIVRSILKKLDKNDLAGVKAEIASHEGDNPNDEQLLQLKASMALAEGDRVQAKKLLARALVHHSEHFGSLQMLGNIFLNEGDLEHAVRLYSRALRVSNQAQLEQLAAGWQVLINEGINEPVTSPRLAFIVRHDLDQFLDDITRELVPDYEVRKFVVNGSSGVDEALEWGDICWFEWCNDPLIYGSKHPLARRKKLICRLHRYEAFSGFPQQVMWENVDRLILVTNHLQHVLDGTLFGLTDRVEIEVIQNGLNLSDFPVREREHGFNLAYIGYLHLRKNPMMLLQIVEQLVRRDERYQLFLAGKFQDPVAHLYWEHMVQQMGLEDHIHFDGWQDKIAAWLEDKDYVVSTSIHESFGYAIAEGMARGIKPVVHNFPFAREIWAEEMLFNTVAEAVEMIMSKDYASHAYRGFIECHYSLERQMERTRALLDALSDAPSDPSVSGLKERIRLRTAS